MKPSDAMLSSTAAAEYLGISVHSLNQDRTTQRGRLGVPYEKRGRKVIYRRSALDRWCEAQTVVPMRS